MYIVGVGLVKFLQPWDILLIYCNQFSSVTQSRPTICNPLDCKTPGFPVRHQLMFIESVMPYTHLNLCCPLLLLPSIYPSIRVFSNESVLPIRWPKYWSFSFSIVLPVIIQDWFLYVRLAGSPCSPRNSQEFSPIAQFKSINSSALSFLYGRTIPSILDIWKNHSLTRRTFVAQVMFPAFWYAV